MSSTSARVPPPEGSFAIGGDLVVRRMGFGSMRLTGPGVWGPPRDPDGARAILRRVVELGVGLIDTADSYGPEACEELIAETLYPYPQGVVIATKGGMLRPGPGRWERDGRPEHLREAAEHSLRRLRLERIDLYQLHAVDHRVPLEDSVGALADLRAEGKIRHIGLSNVDVHQLARARRIAPIVSVQNRYSIADRFSDPVIDMCDRDGLAFLPYFPLGMGALARHGSPVATVARRTRATPGQLALAWLLRRARVVLPIPGTANLAHLEENVTAADLLLATEDVAALTDALSPA